MARGEEEGFFFCYGRMNLLPLSIRCSNNTSKLLCRQEVHTHLSRDILFQQLSTICELRYRQQAFPQLRHRRRRRRRRGHRRRRLRRERPTPAPHREHYYLGRHHPFSLLLDAHLPSFLPPSAALAGNGRNSSPATRVVRSVARKRTGIVAFAATDVLKSA